MKCVVSVEICLTFSNPCKSIVPKCNNFISMHISKRNENMCLRNIQVDQRMSSNLKLDTIQMSINRK